MATAPQSTWIEEAEDDQELYDLPLPPNYPGSTVDILIEQSKVEEAHTEFERLIQEGIDSGPGIEVTPDFYEDLLAEVRRKAEAQK